MAGAGIVKFGDWINDGWKMFQTQWQSWSLLGFIYFLAIMVVILIPYFGLIFSMVAIAEGMGSGSGGGGAVIALLFVFLWIFLILAVLSYLMGGLYKAAFKHLDGETISAGDIFSGGPYTFRILGAMLIITVLTMVGALLCIFPAFIVGGVTFFAVPLIVRKDMGSVEAIKESYEFCKQDWLMFTFFAFVVSLIAQIGTYACYIGLIFTIPLMFTISVTAFKDCFEGGGTSSGETAVQITGETKSCSTCGVPIPVDSSFCANCGASQI